MTKILFVLNIIITTRGELLAGEQVRKKNIEDMLESPKDAGILIQWKQQFVIFEWMLHQTAGEEVIVNGATVYVDGRSFVLPPHPKIFEFHMMFVFPYSDMEMCKNFSAKKGVVVSVWNRSVSSSPSGISIYSGIKNGFLKEKLTPDLYVGQRTCYRWISLDETNIDREEVGNQGLCL